MDGQFGRNSKRIGDLVESEQNPLLPLETGPYSEPFGFPSTAFAGEEFLGRKESSLGDSWSNSNIGWGRAFENGAATSVTS